MENGTATGYWQLTIVMIVVASWLVYRYLAPKGWKEWSRAGLLQDFIIALYAKISKVIAEFGETYQDYQRRVPEFFPRFGEWHTLLGDAKARDLEAAEGPCPHAKERSS